LAGNELRSCPLLLCDDEDLSLAAQYVDPAIAFKLVAILQTANQSFWRFFSHYGDVQSGGLADGDLDLDVLLPGAATNDVPSLFLQACASAARITRRTASGHAAGFDDVANEPDVQTIHGTARFVGLKAWTGLPYIYVWVYVLRLFGLFVPPSALSRLLSFYFQLLVLSEILTGSN
jgi:hypothetical protein